MLSAETAVGRFPVEAVGMLHDVVVATESEYASRMASYRLVTDTPAAPSRSLAFIACELAEGLNAKAIVVPADGIVAAAQLARFRPRAHVIAVTCDESLCRQLAMLWGVIPLYSPDAHLAQGRMRHASAFLRQRRLARPGDPLVFLSSGGACAGVSDTLQVIRLD
jgi:pyruvate kinase